MIQIKPVPKHTSPSRDIKATEPIPYHEYVDKWFLTIKQEKPGLKTMEILTEIAKRYNIEMKTYGVPHKQNGKEKLGCLETADFDVLSMSSDDESESDMDDEAGCSSCVVFD